VARLRLEADGWDEGPALEVKPDLIKSSGTKATVSLNDCLACRWAIDWV
jgi:hypothetical protein